MRVVGRPLQVNQEGLGMTNTAHLSTNSDHVTTTCHECTAAVQCTSLDTGKMWD